MGSFAFGAYSETRQVFFSKVKYTRQPRVCLKQVGKRDMGLAHIARQRQLSYNCDLTNYLPVTAQTIMQGANLRWTIGKLGDWEIGKLGGW